MTDWHPIETAPKDGTRVLLARPNMGVVIGYWWDQQTLMYGQPKGKHYQEWAYPGVTHFFGEKGPDPTHWMPLPDLPT